MSLRKQYFSFPIFTRRIFIWGAAVCLTAEVPPEAAVRSCCPGIFRTGAAGEVLTGEVDIGAVWTGEVLTGEERGITGLAFAGMGSTRMAGVLLLAGICFTAVRCRGYDC